MLTDQKIEVTPVDGYTHYNFAIFTGSLHNFFDALRYDRAFLARKADVEVIVNHINNEHWRVLPSPILLGMYDWSKKPRWTHARLCSGQRLEEVRQVSELYALGSDITVLQPKPKLKVKIELLGVVCQPRRRTPISSKPPSWTRRKTSRSICVGSQPSPGTGRYRRRPMFEFEAGIDSTGILAYPLVGQLVTEDVGHLPEFKEMDEIFSIVCQSRRPDPQVLREMCRRMAKLQEALERRIRSARANCN